MILKELAQENNNLETKCLLQDIPMQLWALSSRYWQDQVSHFYENNY